MKSEWYISMYNIIASLIVGSLAGYIYGLLFIASKEKALSHATYAGSRHLVVLSLTLIRFAFLGTFLIYLLRWDFLVSILTLASFIATFWLIIIRKGLVHHEGRNPN